MKVSRILTALAVALSSAVLATPVLAATPSPTTAIGSGLDAAAGGAGYQTGAVSGTQLPILVGSIIGILLQLVGVLLLGYMLYAGFLWMTAGGDKAKVEKATTTIRNTLIGLVIIVLAYSITGYVLFQLSVVSNGGTVEQTAPTPVP